MELKGTRRLKGPPDAVWAALTDPAFLQENLPGCRWAKANPSDPNEIQLEVAVEVGPLSVTFTGQGRATEAEPPRRARLTAEGRARPVGSAEGWAEVALAPDGDGTRLSYSGEATVGGQLLTIPSIVIAAKAHELIDALFDAIGAMRGGGGREKFVDRLDHAPAGVPILGDEPSERVVEDPAERAGAVIEEVEERIEAAAAQNVLGGPMVWGMLVLIVLIIILVLMY